MTTKRIWTTRREAMALLTGAVAGVALGGEARAQGTPKRGGVLRVSAFTNPSSLDPATGGAGSDHAFLFTMYDTLTEWEFDTLKPKPGLAESWSFTDPTTFVLNIRPGVTFHDGTPLDAEAVKFNFERNKTDPKSNIKADLATMASVAVTGPMQVTLKLNTPDAAMPGILSDRAGMMVSPTAVKANARCGQSGAYAGWRRRLCLCQLGRRRTHRGQAQRKILEGKPALSRWYRVCDHSRTDDRRALGHRRAKRPHLSTAAAPEGRRRAIEHPQGRQRADALCLSDFPELGEAAVRRCQGPQGFQLRHRSRSLRQGIARGPCRTGPHEPAEIALGLRQIGRRALSLRSRQGAQAARRGRLQGGNDDRGRQLSRSGFGSAPGDPDRAAPQGRYQPALPQRAGCRGGRCVFRRRETRLRAARRLDRTAGSKPDLFADVHQGCVLQCRPGPGAAGTGSRDQGVARLRGHRRSAARPSRPCKGS